MTRKHEAAHAPQRTDNTYGLPQRFRTVVYFLKEDHPGGGIKIGNTFAPGLDQVLGITPRIRQLQVGNSSEIVLIAYEPAPESRERELHHQFSHLKRRGEWFEPAEEIYAYISANNAGLKDSPLELLSPVEKERMSNDLLDDLQASAYTGMHFATIRKEIRLGNLKPHAYAHNRSPLFLRKDLDAWLVVGVS